MDVAVLGSGMGGLGAAHALRSAGRKAVVYDKNHYPGGHTSSHIREGFTFDEGPHVSFTGVERLKSMFSSAIGGNFESINAYIDNYWKGHWVRHPVVTNLYGLPAEVRVQVLKDFIESRQEKEPVIRNYEDWLVASYGRAYAEMFPMQYTRKYHTTDAANLSTEWVGPRLYQAKLEEVLLAAVAPATPNIHYVQDYRYPTDGGFAAFLRDFISSTNIELDHAVVGVEPDSGNLRFASGRTAHHDRIVSSIPLPDLIPMIDGTPRHVREAADKLACTTVVLVNLGVDREDLSKASWTYFYDEEFPFSRVSFPRTFSPRTCPPGTGSIQCEVYFSRKYRPLTESPESCIEPTIAGLRRCGVLRATDQIVFREAMLIPYANIIFDLERESALTTVHGYLDDIGIGYCGRYGEWGYLWSDESFLSGERAVERLLTRP
jgi:protoporphyrinogen oxidase